MTITLNVADTEHLIWKLSDQGPDREVMGSFGQFGRHADIGTRPEQSDGGIDELAG